MAQGSDDGDLIQQRRALFEQFHAIRSPLGAATFQRSLAMALLSAERKRGEARSAKRKNAAAELGEHATLLRTFGDALIWLNFHSHVIRQLKKQGAGPTNLTSQGDSFLGVLAVVEQLAQAGVFAFASDLTNCLRLGDIVVADDPDAPTIIECKKTLPKDGDLLWGQRGRQLNRLLGTVTYLREGVGSVYGDEMPRLCVEVDKGSASHWQHVEQAVRRRMANESAVIEAEAGQVIWGRRENDPLPSALRDALRNYRVLAIGLHTRFCDDDAPIMAPPLAWPVPKEQQWALNEGEIHIVTLLDVGQFSEHARKLGRVVRIPEDGAGLAVETRAGELLLSARFVDDCLYCYSSLADTVEVMLEFADKAAAMMMATGGEALDSRDMPEEERAAGPGRVWAIRSDADLESFERNNASAKSSDVVMADTNIWSNLLSKAGLRRPPGLLLWSTGDNHSEDDDLTPPSSERD